MTVKIHYLDGSNYTLRGVYVDGSVDWSDRGTTFIDFNGETSCKVRTSSEEILYIEQTEPECGMVIVSHPAKHPMSIKVEVMTANSRCKANNNNHAMDYCLEDVQWALWQQRESFKKAYSGDKSQWEMMDQKVKSDTLIKALLEEVDNSIRSKYKHLIDDVEGLV